MNKKVINMGGDLSNEQIRLCDSKDFEKEKLYQSFSQHDIAGNHGNVKIMQNNNFSKIKKLREQGYVERGCGDWQAYTYYITEKGLKLIKNEEENEHA